MRLNLPPPPLPGKHVSVLAEHLNLVCVYSAVNKAHGHEDCLDFWWAERSQTERLFLCHTWTLESLFSLQPSLTWMKAWAGGTGAVSGHEGVIKPGDGKTVEEIQGCARVYWSDWRAFVQPIGHIHTQINTACFSAFSMTLCVLYWGWARLGYCMFLHVVFCVERR